MPETLTVSVLEAGEKDRIVMRSLLNIAGANGGKGEWRIIDELGGKLIIVDVDHPQGEALWRSLSDAGHQPVAMTRQRQFSAPRVLRKPLNSRRFLGLLSDEQDGPAVSPPDSANDALTDWAEPAAAEDGLTLADHLRQQSWLEPVVLQPPGWPRLVIDPGSGSWFFDGALGDMTPQMFAQPIPVSAGQPVSSRDLVSEQETVTRRPLSELKWFSGLAQSRGQLHPELQGEISFMLTQAPKEAMDHERFARLARILLRAPVNVEELTLRSGEALENIAAFLNACYCTGRLLVNRTATSVSG